jgi:drug/metabolite transporter, DME family
MKKKGYVFFIIVAAILWSTDGLLRRHLHEIPSTSIVLIENIIRLIILSPFISRFIPEFKKMNKKDWIVMITLGVTSGALGSVLYTSALAQVQNISYSVVALLQQTQPIFAVLLAVILLKEKISKRYMLFGSIALISAYFLTFPELKPSFISGNGELIAALLALGAAFVWGFGTVLSKIMLKKLSYAALVILRFTVTVPVVFALNIGLKESYPISLINGTQWFYLIVIAIISGIVSFALYYKGLQHTEVKVSTFAEFAWPLSAALLGYFVLNETLTLTQWIAGAILLIDIYFLSSTPKKS